MRNLRANLVAAILFLIPLGVYLLATLFPLQVSEPIKHLFLTLTAVMGVHLLDRLVLVRETLAALANLTEGILAEVRDQTKSLVGTSASLQSMLASGIGRLYSGREDAAADMGHDMINPSNKSIRLIGISLNDFLRADDRTLADTWVAIKKRLLDEDRPLDVKILLIDPECFGAQMRSRGEARAEEAIVGRLSEDVIAVAESLLKLEKHVKEAKKQHILFECRFYRLAPILFLCQVDSASYVQQYYFWSQRNANRASPVIRFRQSERTSDGLMHEGMRDHFDWVWEHASIPIEVVLEAKSIGAEKGLHQSGIVNIFASGGEGFNRIRWLLEHAQSTVWIQGVSLRSFFDPGLLFNAIVALIKRKNVNLRVLLIDRECQQAKYRSYREQLFANRDLTFDSYIASGQHAQSNLFRDTERSLANIRAQMTALRGREGQAWQPKLCVREYATAPLCFMIRVDDTVLVEQYHYGKIVPEDQMDAPTILGKDMPLIEYQRVGSPLYEPVELRSPFGLLNDHFEFAFARGTELTLWKDTAPEMPSDS